MEAASGGVQEGGARQVRDNAIVREILAVAREVVGGLFEPPPKMVDSKVRKLTEPYDDVDSLECDGMTRVLHTVLTRNKVPHKVMGGSVTFGEQFFEPHFWIEISGGIVVDYRIRMWFGRSAPHGVFNPKAEGIEYEGRPVHLGVLPDFLFGILTGGMSVVSSVSRTAGVLHPPPALVDDIYRWANAQLAAHRAWHTENDLKESRMYLQRALDQAEAAREKGDLEYAKEREERAQWFREGIEKEEIRLAALKQEVRQYPRVTVKKWNRVKRKFKVNMAGWRYLPKVRDAEPKRRAHADNLFGVVTVELVRGDLYTDGKAYWRAESSTLRIKIGGDLRHIIEHELRHWAQSYMNVILGKAGEFGRPSKDIRTPDINQWAKGDAARVLRQHGIEPNEFHGLDDVEFYTDLAGEIRNFERAWDRPKIRDSFGSLRNFFRVFVGLKDYNGDYRVGSPFFKSLQRHSRGKWQKAVKELAKAVL